MRPLYQQASVALEIGATTHDLYFCEEHAKGMEKPGDSVTTS